MAGKTGEAALQEKLEQIKLDYLGLIEKIKTENVKAASDLEKKLLKDDEDFKARQERERREFEVRMEIEKEEFKEKQKREREIADGEASERLKQAETFIDNVKSPVVKDKHKLGQMDIGWVGGIVCWAKINLNLFPATSWSVQSASRRWGPLSTSGSVRR